MKMRKIFFGLFILAMLLLLPYVIMLLWNGILPAVIGVKSITYLQAMGLFILSRIMFGGFKSGGRPGRPSGFQKSAFAERMMHMNEEEKAAFKEKWKERFGK